MLSPTATENMLNDTLKFDVDHLLFKGRLLADFQIEATSRNRELVQRVEAYFSKWMNQIEVAMIEGKQITEQPADVGPRHELQHWRWILTRYSSAAEFIDGKAFKNHLECLVLSRSKLVKVPTNVSFNSFPACKFGFPFRNGVRFTRNWSCC